MRSMDIRENAAGSHRDRVGLSSDTLLDNLFQEIKYRRDVEITSIFWRIGYWTNVGIVSTEVESREGMKVGRVHC